jgi:hypothetical protein
MIEKALDEIAERNSHAGRSVPVGLLEKYRLRMEAFEPSRNWEKSVILFFVINASARRITSSTPGPEAPGNGRERRRGRTRTGRRLPT